MKSATLGVQAAFAVVLLSGSASGAYAGGPDLRLIDAIQKQDKQAAQQLIQQRVDVNAQRADGTTALAWAVHWDDLDTVAMLIRAGANVNLANDLGVTPLMLASVNANADIATKLFEASADANLTRSNGETA